MNKIIGYCIHRRPISSPSVPFECMDCFKLAQIERQKPWWREK